MKLDVIRLTTSADRYTTAPGNRLDIPMTLTNLGDTPYRLQVSIIGIPQVWVLNGASPLTLHPGEQRQVVLTIQPPAPPSAHVGRYSLILRAASMTDPARMAQAQAVLTIAGYEFKGRVDVLLEGVQFALSPGEQRNISVMLINHGLGVDIFRLAVEGLPADWVTVPVAALRLEPDEVKEAALFIHPPRRPTTSPGSYPFRIRIASQEAHHQVASVDCDLSISEYLEFKSNLEVAALHRAPVEQVTIRNLSNAPVIFQVTCSSPADTLIFQPVEPQEVHVASGETAAVAVAARPTRRLWIGGEKRFPHTITIQAAGREAQRLEALWIARGLLPVWALLAAGGVLLILLLYVAGTLLARGI